MSGLNKSNVKLPYYAAIPIPANLSLNTKKQIDSDGDGKISNVEEAWKVYALAKNGKRLTHNDRIALKRILSKLTKVNTKIGVIKVFGKAFRFFKPPEGHPYKEHMFNGYKDEQYLFVMGEAMRSFGAKMVYRWAHGIEGEPPLILIAMEPHIYELNPFNKSIKDTIVDEIANKVDYRTANGSYYYLKNNLVIGTGAFLCGFTIKKLYKMARHELGHSVDDFMLPFDNDLFLWEMGKKRTMYSASLGKFVEGDTYAVEMFAGLFEDCDELQNELPDLVSAIKHYLY